MRTKPGLKDNATNKISPWISLTGIHDWSLHSVEKVLRKARGTKNSALRDGKQEQSNSREEVGVRSRVALPGIDRRPRPVHTAPVGHEKNRTQSHNEKQTEQRKIERGIHDDKDDDDNLDISAMQDVYSTFNSKRAIELGKPTDGDGTEGVCDDVDEPDDVIIEEEEYPTGLTPAFSVPTSYPT